MSKKDYYEILGIDRSASEGDIKQAYRKMARTYHPDVSKDVDKKTAEDRFKEINEAYEVLSDNKKRATYDQFGHDAFRPGAGGGGFSDFGGFSGFGDMGGFGGFDDLFDMFFRGGSGESRRNYRSQPQRGNDIRADTTLTLEDVVFGVEKEIQVNVLRTCSVCFGTGASDGASSQTCTKCQGSGQERIVQSTMFGRFIRTGPCSECRGEGTVVTNPCGECDGKGRARKKRKIMVKIPPGVDEGFRVRVPGEGESGIKGGSAGDLYVFVSVRAHKVFRRINDDLYCEREISFPRAALGSTIKVPTIDGESELEIPAGTQSETLFKLKEYGIPNVRSGKKGDLRVKVIVKVPTKLNADQKKLLKEFATASGEDLSTAAQQEKGLFERFKEGVKGAFGGGN